MEIIYKLYEEVNAYRHGIIYGTGQTLEECDQDALSQIADKNYDLVLDYDSIDETGHWELVREGGTYEDEFVKPKLLASGASLPDYDGRDMEEGQ